MSRNRESDSIKQRWLNLFNIHYSIFDPKKVIPLYITNKGTINTQQIAVKGKLTNPPARYKEYSTGVNGTPGMESCC
ncbi:hypothetical protein [Photorhabdus laumondii]|uniref:hypothetical protein n=1 Tax=Photorhabdus laumondii TaxID=2218628 RepID=UPI0011BE9E19|nr:hypothetical protein [Photorhabdus laumondii]